MIPKVLFTLFLFYFCWKSNWNFSLAVYPRKPLNQHGNNFIVYFIPKKALYVFRSMKIIKKEEEERLSVRINYFLCDKFLNFLRDKLGHKSSLYFVYVHKNYQHSPFVWLLFVHFWIKKLLCVFSRRVWKSWRFIFKIKIYFFFDFRKIHT